MARILASVEFAKQQSCFATISWPLQKKGFSDLNVLKVETEGGVTAFLSVVGEGSGNSSHSNFQLRIHPKLASLLSLKEKENVHVSEVSGIFSIIRKATVTCASEDDWEILESNTDVVINSMLNQIRVIYPGLEFPFWVTKSMQINLRIKDIEPLGEFGVLNSLSEIIVPSIVSSNTEKMFSSSSANSYFQLRVHPLPIPDSVVAAFPSSSLLLKNTRHAFVSKAVLKRSGKICPSSFFAEILSPSCQPAVVRVFILEDSGISPDLIKFLPVTKPHCVYLHPELIRGLEIQTKSQVWLKVVPESEKKPEEMGKLFPLGECPSPQDENKFRIFTDLLTQCQQFLEASLSLGEWNQPFIGPENGALLIEGTMGTGKTSFCKTLCERLEGPPFFVHWELVACAKWRGKKAETIEKEFSQILARGKELKPSIIILDDLDVFTPVDMTLQESFQEQFLHFKLCESIKESLLSLGESQIGVIATTRSTETLNPYWKSRQGFHFFHKIVTLPSLNSAERLHIFEETLTNIGVEIPPQLTSCQIQNLLKNIHDQRATPRLIVNICKKLAANPRSESTAEMLDGIIQEEIRFVDIESGPGKKDPPVVKWDDVGGVSAVKEELIRTIQWPIKYKSLFKNAPIRLPSGILLYGYPGTGKTLTALSIPTLVNSKFIHVKGPELLSKYIGASEQAVQDVFKRARNSSPCVIFFDEFDSLVPRRGHDSTGVTDRVVNQFLAEMDGIEGGLGQGVYLIGATSRPDLIDPAVLRPGRLDKHLFFDLPAKEGRMEILSKLGKKVNLNFDASDSSGTDASQLDKVADKIAGFSGADIQALVCSAQLSAVQKYLAKRKDESGFVTDSVSTDDKLSPSDIPVQFTDVESALEKFRPSLQGNELLKFKRIYQGFSREDGMGNTKKIQEITGKRATLA